MEKIDILLVEPDQKTLTQMSELFAAQGLSFITAQHPHQALELLEHYDIKAVVAEALTPEMNGIELCKGINKYYPVVMVCNGHQFEGKIEAYCDCFIERGEIGQRLFKATMKAIERHQMHQDMMASSEAA